MELHHFVFFLNGFRSLQNEWEVIIQHDISVFLVETQLIWSELRPNRSLPSVSGVSASAACFLALSANHPPFHWNILEIIEDFFVPIHSDGEFFLFIAFHHSDFPDGGVHSGAEVDIGGIKEFIDGQALEFIDDDGEFGGEEAGEVAEGGGEAVVEFTGEEVVGDATDEYGGSC